MSEETWVDLERLQDIAATLGGLMTGNDKHFEALRQYEPAFGDFETAHWLGEVIGAHRDAVLAHVAYLRRILAEIPPALTRIAQEAEETDAANARAVTGVGDPRSR